MNHYLKISFSLNISFSFSEPLCWVLYRLWMSFLRAVLCTAAGLCLREVRNVWLDVIGVTEACSHSVLLPFHWLLARIKGPAVLAVTQNIWEDKQTSLPVSCSRGHLDRWLYVDRMHILVDLPCGQKSNIEMVNF